jgi:hypothetical protein
MAKSDPQDTRHTHSKRGNKWSDKTIEVTVRFWTDGIAEKGTVIQRNAWDSGTVSMKQNKLHWIRPSAAKPFNSILELPSVLAEVLAAQKIVLHPGKKLQKIFKT